MNGSGPRLEGRQYKVLVYEYVTGGGLIGQDFPESWAIEGSAMRRAIVRDFAAVSGVQIIMPVDARLTTEELPGVTIRVVDQGEPDVLESIAAEVNQILVIAPETGGVLARLTSQVVEAGGTILGSLPRAIRMTGDKARLADHFADFNIPSPPTRMVELPARELPGDWEGPVVVKPRDGAGSVDTTIVRDRRCPDWVTPHQRGIAQPYLPGHPMSASFLVDVAGRSTLLGVGRQRIAIDQEGRISYQGGTILAAVNQSPTIVEAAINSVNAILGTQGLRGFVGVDYLDDPEAGIHVLEINPRPTTSYVGLAALLGPGTMAGAWLAATEGPLDSTAWPDRIRSSRTGPDISFQADGTLVPRNDER